jgi:hypothetical protein
MAPLAVLLLAVMAIGLFLSWKRGDLAGALRKLGFAAGAALANSARANSYAVGDGHVAACEDAYRSYDPRTDTYLGYDGMRHYCEL